MSPGLPCSRGRPGLWHREAFLGKVSMLARIRWEGCVDFVAGCQLAVLETGCGQLSRSLQVCGHSTTPAGRSAYPRGLRVESLLRQGAVEGQVLGEFPMKITTALLTSAFALVASCNAFAADMGAPGPAYPAY